MSEEIKEEMKEEKGKTAKENTEPEKEAKTKSKKKCETKEQIEKLNKELEEQKNLLLRTAAEFDNYKKRTEKEKLSTAEYSKASVLKLLLPVIDNIDRANTSPQDVNSQEYVKGLTMIIKQFSEIIMKTGIEEIGKKGDTFDPNLHEAVMHVSNPDFAENTVSEVLQKGYKIGDTVIRPAMVQVAN